VNAKDVHLMGHLPVCPLKVKIHFNAMYASYSLTKLLEVFSATIMHAYTCMDGLCYGGSYVCKESITILYVASMFW
jgi:hypothetical protein